MNMAPGDLHAVQDDDWREPYPAWWFDYGDPLPSERCRALWAAVLLWNLRDSLKNELDRLHGRRESLMKGRASAGWFQSAAFREVAQLAGLSGEALQQRIFQQCADAGGIRALLDELNPTGNHKNGGL